MPSLYSTLGVERGASPKEIKRAYYALAHACHPDKRPGDAAAAAQFQAISLAYTVLADARARQRYDLLGPVALGQPLTLEDLSHFGPEAERIGQLLHKVVHRVGKTVQRAQAVAAQRRGVAPKTDAQVGAGGAEATVAIDVAQACMGGRAEVRIERQVPCRSCRGSGAAAGTAPSACTTCRGSGRARLRDRLLTGLDRCVDCAGQGLRPLHPCPPCAGRGTQRQPAHLQLRIPADAAVGERLRLAGAAGAGRDLHVRLEVVDHPLVRRDGLDLVATLWLTPSQAALGGPMRYALWHSTVPLMVPPGTQPGDALVVPGAGLRAAEGDGGGRGALRLEVALEVPRLDAAEAELAALHQTLRAHEASHEDAFPRRAAHLRAMREAAEATAQPR